MSKPRMWNQFEIQEMALFRAPRRLASGSPDFLLSLSCCPFPTWPGCGMPPLSYWLPGLAQSWPYFPLVWSWFLPWLTVSYISNRFHARSLLIALMLEAASSSETLVNFCQTTWRYNPQDSHLRTHHRENLKFYYVKNIWKLQYYFLLYII
jgi:hypothetical protein